MIKISKRLEVIAKYVSDDSKVVDIGCDHGLLDIYLYNNKKDISIIASDINKNALDNAIKNIEKYGLKDKIEVIISDGLNNINTNDIDTIVMAGMGAHTIVGILYSNAKKLKKVKDIIVQSNNDVDFLRGKITKIGYYIESEELVKDASIIYTVIRFRRGHRFYTKKQLYFGPCLMKDNSDLFREKKRVELSKLESIYPMIPKNYLLYRFKIWKKIRMYK